MQDAMTQVLNALTLSSLLGIVALGLAITFGLMGIINLAHGAFVMIGAYSVALLTEVGVPTIIAILVAPVVTALVGVVVEETVIKRLYARPLDTLLATWGVSLVLGQLVKILFSANQRGVDPLIRGTVHVLGTPYPAYRIFVIVASTLVIVAFLLLFYRSDFGVRLRAVIENRSMASAIGIRARQVDRIAFAIGAATAGFAGAIVAPFAPVNPTMGLPWLIRGFLVVIVGGEAAPGVVAGSLLIGGGDSVFSFLFDAVNAQMLVLIVAIVVLRLFPAGLVRNKR